MLSELKRTQRGFRYYAFEDNYGIKCSLQKSSAADEPKIWLGTDSANPKTLVPGEGWQDVEISDEILLTTRMHLTMEQAGVLAKQLEYFSETGELPRTPYG